MVSGSAPPVRDMYSNEYDTKDPMFKLLLLCNDLPRIKSVDDAMWRRVKALFNFPNTYTTPHALGLVLDAAHPHHK